MGWGDRGERGGWGGGARVDSSRTSSFLLLRHCHPMQAFIRNTPGYVLTGRPDSWDGWVPGSANGMHVHVGPHGRAPLWGHTGPIARPAWWVPMGVLYGAEVWGARAVVDAQVYQDVENGPCTWCVGLTARCTSSGRIAHPIDHARSFSIYRPLRSLARSLSRSLSRSSSLPLSLSLSLSLSFSSSLSLSLSLSTLSIPLSTLHTYSTSD